MGSMAAAIPLPFSLCYTGYTIEKIIYHSIVDDHLCTDLQFVGDRGRIFSKQGLYCPCALYQQSKASHAMRREMLPGEAAKGTGARGVTCTEEREI